MRIVSTIFIAALLAVPSAAQGVSVASVHYQVVYTDGKIRDLSAVPRDNRGIDRVTRIARLQLGDGQGGQSWFIGRDQMGVENAPAGATVKTQLEWTGSAWTAPQIVVEVPASQPAPSGESDAPQDAAPPQRVPSTMPTSAPADLPPPMGKVVTTQPAEPVKGTIGVDKPLQEQVVAGHRVQVWRMPTGKGTRTYTVSMAHPEAGEGGAFSYVAYADTNGDQKPDKLIARSPRAQADTAGQWTQWSFQTDAADVYIGNAWSGEQTTIYGRKTEPDDKNLLDITGDVCVSRDPESGKWQSAMWISNIRISVK